MGTMDLHSQIGSKPGSVLYSYGSLVDRIGICQDYAVTHLKKEQRSAMGQFLTPSPVARLMASMFRFKGQEHVRLLDPGAGAGMLAAATVEAACGQEHRPKAIHVTAFEVDPTLTKQLEITLTECDWYCQQFGIEFAHDLISEDFIEAGVSMLEQGLFSPKLRPFGYVILNPPYHKIHSKSLHRLLLRRIGLETGNLYSGFLAVAAGLLEPDGQLVAITPRSFCNGPYFRAFREFFLSTMGFTRIHTFESRADAFKSDDVLQENIVFHAVRSDIRSMVLLSGTENADDQVPMILELAHDQVVDPNDPNLIIKITTNGMDQLVAGRMSRFTHSLDDIGVKVSTGRVVDFRARKHLRPDAESNTVPLVYPIHFNNGFIEWPQSGSKKPNAIVRNADTESLLLPSGTYVLVRRFSSKEERRRIVAAISKPENVPGSWAGFENHLNVYHCDNAGLAPNLANGLAVFLNSTLVDSFFRQFSGHTQVNATDLRMLRYPGLAVLERIGSIVGDDFPTQGEIDAVMEREVIRMADTETADPVAANQKIRDAIEILKAIGLPRQQQNNRSGLTLLALLNLEPDTAWKQAGSPHMGITPIMDFCRAHYGYEYAPNTRETFRRQTMHQFVYAGIAIPNPDEPDRPINSPKWCYQIEETVLDLVRTWRSDEWADNLKTYLAGVTTLRDRYARRRTMQMIPVTLPDGQAIELTPGDHNILTKAIVEQFAPRYAPGGQVIYIGDTGDKWACFDEKSLQELGVTVDAHGKMPDVVIYHEANNWLLLIEAVTSHGPVDAKRREELTDLFAGAKPSLIYVTAFLTRADMTTYLGDISWETDVWIVDSPTHLIHFDGARFLGPYDN